MDKDLVLFKVDEKDVSNALKTCVSDYSISSNNSDSRPGSAMDIVNLHKSRASLKGFLGTAVNSASDLSQDSPIHNQGNGSTSLSEASLEWESPKHGWHTVPKTPLSCVSEVPVEDQESFSESPMELNASKEHEKDSTYQSLSSTVDAMASLEWDNEGFEQYPEEAEIGWNNEGILPDHLQSLEIDMEQELVGCIREDFRNSEENSRKSVDSESIPDGAAGSPNCPSTFINRKSSCPVRCELPAAEEKVSTTTSISEKKEKLNLDEIQSKMKMFWNSEESGYMEGDSYMECSNNSFSASITLSPIHEIKRNDGCSSQAQTSCSSQQSPNSPTGLSPFSCLSPNTPNPIEKDTLSPNANENYTNWEGEHQQPQSLSSSFSSSHSNIQVKHRTKQENSQSWASSMNRDSAYCDSGFDLHRVLENIGDKVDLLTYSETEWRGHTQRAETIRKGYAQIPLKLGLHHIRSVRGDNYCALRATLFKTLSQGLPIPNGTDTYLKLQTALSNGSEWLTNWSFANRLPYGGNNVLEGIKQCLDSLDNMTMELSGAADRECHLVNTLNSDPDLDIQLLEGLKLHMLSTAMELHNSNLKGEDLPVFAALMFARDTSLTPQDLMNNHLNCVGDTGGLEQIEMYLLCHTLKIHLLVVRPSAYGQQDYITYFPDWNVGNWPQVPLITEDDRHYNIIML